MFSLAFVWLSVCLSGFQHIISKTAAVRITKLDTEMFNRESWIHHLFWGQKVRGQGHEAQKKLLVFALL